MNEKIYQKRSLFARNYRFKLLVMAKCCILFFLCATTNVINGSLSYYPVRSANTFNDSTSYSTLQEYVVKGTVKDASSGEALIGVTVRVQGTTLGTLTDINGKFSLTIPDRQAILSFSFIGFTTQELPVSAGADMNVLMSLEVTQIGEVLVVGYGTQKKESVVGAITQVADKELAKSGDSNITTAIAGKLSGILTIQQSGQPGQNQAEIYVRGLSSWNSSTPLVMIDGVERDFNDMDPNEIETISVLKDASATAVFGAKGANGVIIVTTKRGSLSKPKLTFSATYGSERPSQLPPHIDSYTTMSMMNVGLKNNQIWSEIFPDNILEEYRNPSTPLNSIRYPDVDWFDLLSTPFTPLVKSNLSLRGGTKFVKYFCMLGYNYQGSYFTGTKTGFLDSRFYFNRFNYRSNLDFRLTETTQLSLNLGGETGIRNEPYSTLWSNLYSTGTCRYPAYFPEWVLEEVPDTDYPDASEMRFSGSLGDYYGNPYLQVYNGGFNRNVSSKLFTDLFLEQKLDFLLKGLSAKAKVSLSTYFTYLSLYSSFSYPTYELNYEKIGTSENPWFRTGQTLETYKNNPVSLGIGTMGSDYYSDLYYEFSLNYKNSFGKHDISALGLMNRQQKNRGTEFPYYNEGLVGRVTYEYSKKYLFEVNIGYTGSEQFAPKNRFGFFPSAALGWVISEEPFFRNALPWVNMMKLRYSDGLVGSDYASTRWLYISYFSKDRAGYYQEDPAANISARWEEAHKRDIGLEFGIFKNLITFSLDLFDEQRYHMLVAPANVTLLTGNSFKELNLGKLKKHGLELELGFNKTTASGMNYFAKAILGLNENRVIERSEVLYSPDYKKSKGKSLDAFMSGLNLTGTGYYTTIEDIHNNTSPSGPGGIVIGDYKYLDFDANGIITSQDSHPIPGNPYPPITYSFSSGLTYKNFDLHFMFMGNAKKYASLGGSYRQEFYFGCWRVQESQVNYWRPDNQDNASNSTLHHLGANTTNLFSYYQYGIIDNKWVVPVDFLRLKEIYAGYTFTSNLLSRIAGISKVLVYANGNNLLTISDFKLFDPDRTSIDAVGYYPIMKSVQVGLTIDF